MNLEDYTRLTEDELIRIVDNINPVEKLFLSESNKLEGDNSIIALADSILAWDYAKTNESSNIDHSYVKNIHFLLMKTINKSIGGNYRSIRLCIGDREDTYLPKEILAGMEEWCKDFNKTKNSEEEIKKEHVKFLKIHPFADGNGRTARILMNIQRMNSGYGLMIVKKGEIPDGSEDYYGWFE